MAPKKRPLDEVVFHDPELARQFGGIHENTVLFYFAKSPFFDPTSNNATVETQAMFNQEMLSVLETREAFEKHLENLNGVEYRVHLGPKDFGPEAPIGQGVWVIRKQNRHIVYGRGGGAAEDAQITVLATYFVIGEIVCMARSVRGIVESRLLSTTLALSKVHKLASSLSLFTPALGYHYVPPYLKSKKTTPSAQAALTSRETTPAVEAATPGSLAAMPKTAKSRPSDVGSLVDAYRQFRSFGDEFMDENPLLGEPGAFQLSSSTRQVLAQKEAARKRAKDEEEARRAQEEARLAKLRAQEEADAAAARVKKEASVGFKRPAGKEGKSKAKRRKTNRGTPRTPMTPMTPTPVVETPGRDSAAGSTPAGSPR